MILEAAILHVIPQKTAVFETAFYEAQHIIASMPGYISHELHQCMQHEAQYLLLVRWETLENHTHGFRGSPEYHRWKTLLHHFYDPFPTVEHYQLIANGIK